MSKKILPLIIIVLIVGIVLGAIGVLYITQWREPSATYVETSDPKLTSIRENLTELKAELKAKGMYNCCIKNDCNWCALYMGHCPCADMVQQKDKEKSCPECAAAWNKKQGKIPGVDPNAIGVTTFGIYGYEKGGHHLPDFKGSKEEHGGDVHHH